MVTALEPMGAAAEHGDEAFLAEEEARLAHAAAAGDGTAFGTLYERYERRAYNLAHRVTGSEHDAADAVQEAFLSVMRRLPKLEGRELAFGSYLFTATRNACYDLMQKRRRAEPSDSIPESAAPLGSGAGGLGLDPGDPEEDPDRRVLLEAQQDEIREANLRLPERQREALALCELEELSYDEIAEIMDMNRNSVAQLISRARIKLRDELRGTALASIAVSSPDCERALPLIAMRDDGQLDAVSDDADWLEAHLVGCGTCTLSLEAMQEAGTSYRAWTPLVAAPWLLDETMAKAAELVGADWSEEIARRSAERPDLATLPGIPRPYLGAVAKEGSRKRPILVALGLVAVLLIALLATALGDDQPAAPEPVLAPIGEVEAAAPQEPAAKKPKRKPKKEEPVATPSGQAPAVPTAAPQAVTPAPESTPEEEPKRPQRDDEPEPADLDTPVGDDPPVTDPPASDPPTTDPVVTDPPPREPDPPPGGPTGPPIG